MVRLAAVSVPLVPKSVRHLWSAVEPEQVDGLSSQQDLVLVDSAIRNDMR